MIDSTKKGEVRVIVELNFRGEFEMAMGSEDYNRIFRRLPEVFVGKVEYRPKKHNLVRTFTDSKKCGARLSCVRSQFREKTIGW